MFIMKTKCISIKLQSLVSISDKCFKATDFNGNEDLIPKSQVFGIVNSSSKSEAYWISEWILEKKNLTYSHKKIAWHDSETNKFQPHVTISVEKHIPTKIEPIKSTPDAELTR